MNSYNVLLGKFVSYMQIKDFSDTTIKSYRNRTAEFLRWLNENAVEQITDADRAVCQTYQAHLFQSKAKNNGHPIKPRTLEAKLAAVKAFFSFLTATDRLVFDPTADLVFPKHRQSLPRAVLSANQIDSLLLQPNLEKPIGLRDRAVLETLYSTAIRNAELRALSLADLDLDEGFATIREGKGKKDRVVPLGSFAAKFIRLYLNKARPHFASFSRRPTDTLFLSKAGKPIGENDINALIRKYAARANLKKHVTAHVFRHTCATLMLKNKADIRHIQELLGHKSLSTTQRYVRVAITDLKHIHAAHHPREKYKHLFRGNSGNNSGEVKQRFSERENLQPTD